MSLINMLKQKKMIIPSPTFLSSSVSTNLTCIVHTILFISRVGARFINLYCDVQRSSDERMEMQLLFQISQGQGQDHKTRRDSLPGLHSELSVLL